MRRFSIAVAALCLAPAWARGHELWFQPIAAKSAVVRLTFGDSPAPGEAERVAEIDHARAWGDGLPLAIRRLPDGLEATLPEPRPAVLSAYADRGVVDYQGDSFVITLAAYSQSLPIGPTDAPRLGLDDEQLRLLLVSRDGGPPIIRATHRGKRAAGVAVKVFRGTAESTELKTDDRGEIACPDLAKGPISLLATLMEKTPGKRDGKAYSHTRFKATLSLGSASPRVSRASTPEERLARVEEFHGGAGPWAVAGYRIGERALAELGLPRHSFALLVVHRSPAEVQYSCVADGLQAATGASPGKLNLRVEEATVADLGTIVEDRATGRRLEFTLRPEFAASIRDLPPDRFASEARRVAELPDDAIFRMSVGSIPATPH